MNPSEIRLFYHPRDRLRATIGDRSYPTVKPVWAAPLSHPEQYLALLDGKDHEIATLKDPSQLPPESLEAVKQELERRYLTAIVQSVGLAKAEFGATYWHVETDRGPKDFVTQSLQENAQWLGERHLMLIDVDGNRFEILDIAELDAQSQEILANAV